MRIVIPGASGNVGTALLRALTEQNSHDLVGVVRRPPLMQCAYRDVTWHALDLTDPEAPGELSTAGADTVVHLAWGFQPTRNVDYLERLAVGGSTAVIDACHRSGVGQLVHMSSVGAYAAGRYGDLVDETWPTTGIPSSPYSRHKSAVEALLDRYQKRTDAVPVARVRPGFIVQHDAASGLLRYGLPAYLPMGLVPLLPVLPLDRRLCIPLIHAADVADAIVRMIDRRAVGPFNLAAQPPIGRDEVATALGARAVQLPAAVLGALVDLGRRARAELDWEPTWSSTAALADLLTGVTERAHQERAVAAQVNPGSVAPQRVRRPDLEPTGPLIRPARYAP